MESSYSKLKNSLEKKHLYKNKTEPVAKAKNSFKELVFIILSKHN